MENNDKNSVVDEVIHKAEIIPDIKSSDRRQRMKAIRINKPKGAQSKKTKILKAMGLDNWHQVGEFINGKGAIKYTKEVNSLEGEAFVRCYMAMVEYWKPKQVRSEGNVTNIQINNITFE
jgi:hypothetical protein